MSYQEKEEEKKREDQFKLILQSWVRYFFNDVQILMMDMVLEEGGMLFKTHNELSDIAKKYLEKIKKDKIESALQTLIACKLIEEEIIDYKVRTIEGRRKNLTKQEKIKLSQEKKEMEKNKKKFIKININVLHLINLALQEMQQQTKENLAKYSKDSDYWECISCKNRLTKEDFFIKYGNIRECDIKCQYCSGIFRHNKQDKEKEQQYKQFEKVILKLRKLLDSYDWNNKQIPQKYQYTDYQSVKAKKQIQESNQFGIKNESVSQFYSQFKDIYQNENNELLKEDFVKKVKDTEKIFKKQKIAQDQYLQVDVTQHSNNQQMNQLIQQRNDNNNFKQVPGNNNQQQQFKKQPILEIE